MQVLFTNSHRRSKLRARLVAALLVIELVAVVNDRYLQFGFCDDHVLSIEFQGRLGNLLFQLAAAYAIASHNHMAVTLPYVDSGTNQLRAAFDGLRHLRDSPYRRSLRRVEFERWGTFDPTAFDLSTNKCVLLKGYLQSYKYFDAYEHQLRHMLRFNDVIVDDSRRFVEKITSNHRNRTTVGIHVRRGDYRLEFYQGYGYILPDAGYFRQAMKHFRDRFPRVMFVVISDDLQWCQENINGDDVVYGSTDDAATDLCVLSTLDHVILSVGTFSWWAGYLNRGEKVYFRDIARKDSVYARDFNPDDFFPKEWISL